MSFLWISCCVVVFLCCNSQLEVVLAGKNMLGPNDLHMWRYTAHGKDGEYWEKRTSPKRLHADIEPPNGESWLVTPKLKQSRISYLGISANPSQCDGKSSCNLTIYGATNITSNLPVPVTRQYITQHFEPISTMTFPLNTRTLVTSAVITKSYQRLAILTDKTENAKTTWNIYSMELYYYFCERKTIGIDLKQTNSSTTNVTVLGVCPRNAVTNDGIKTNITVKCSVKGEWIVSKDQECICDKGFGLDNSKTCSPCQKDHHKANISNTQCLKCPNGKTNNTMRTECQCKEDYYIGKDKNGSCYELPSAVESFNIVTAETSVKIRWSKPSDGGYNETLTYSVECYHCIQSNQLTWECDAVATDAMFSPSKTSLTTNYVNVSNLTTNETYKFKIVTRNSLKNVPIGEWNYLYSNETKITPPVSTSSKTTPTNPSKSADTSPSVFNPKAKQNDSIMFIGIGIGAGILIVLVIVLVVITKSRRAKSNKDGSDNLGYESVALPTIGQRMYVDPSNYDDPEAAVKDFANEISPKSLNLERVLGGGEFGDVYKGTLKTEDGGVLDVAAKTLKHDSDARSRKDFFMEASAMGQFDDPNVIHLEGVITKSVPHMIVTEYMSNGSLDHFLKQNDENLTDLQLVGMARGVSSGMRYLAAMHFVHRDLAARNVLVTDTLLCKVADFGLSRELETDDSSRGEYCTSGGKIPVRWTAPESIKYRKFSTASDVWSYGILLWEIMAFAERPYWDWDNFKVLERVDEGYRLPAPKNCPKAVHDLMLLCWETDRSQRPQFADIVRMLDDWIRSPETIRYEKIKSMQRPGSGVVNDPAILIKEWLNDIKMSSYVPHFTQAGFRQLSDLAGLLDSDLQAIGVTLIGHRNKMLRTIRSLPITDESKKSPWNRATSFKI